MLTEHRITLQGYDVSINRFYMRCDCSATFYNPGSIEIVQDLFNQHLIDCQIATLPTILDISPKSDEVVINSVLKLELNYDGTVSKIIKIDSSNITFDDLLEIIKASRWEIE